jgi:glutamate---cysteine ligase / carboxylate-amine ligase
MTQTASHPAPAQALTIGVEEEFLVVDAGGQLSYQGADLAGEPDRAPGEVQRELVRCQVETATPVCRDAADALARLTRLRADVGGKAAERGLRLLPSATAVLPQPADPGITPTPRYQRMAAEFGEIAQTSNTCGCHVHVAIPDRETGIAVLNEVRGWLPVLLALSANSPFEAGTVTSYHSWRHVMWSRWPSAGPPPHFDSLDHYESSVEAMLSVGAMLDRAMLYWDVRLSDQQPTAEFRVCDVAATAGEAALLAALIRGLAGTALDRSGRSADPVVPPELLRANLWRAARSGLTGRLLHPVTGEPTPVGDLLTDLVARTAGALDSGGDADLVADGLAAVAESGNGAQRQLAAYAVRQHLPDVVDLLAFGAD